MLLLFYLRMSGLVQCNPCFAAVYFVVLFLSLDICPICKEMASLIGLVCALQAGVSGPTQLLCSVELLPQIPHRRRAVWTMVGSGSIQLWTINMELLVCACITDIVPLLNLILWW